MEESRIKYYIKQATSYPEVLKELQIEHPEICIEAVIKDKESIEDIPEEYGFTTKEIITLLINCNDEELLKNQIEKNEHGFSVRDIQYIMHYIEDSEYVINYAKTHSIQMEKEQRRIELPTGMTIGIEIEAEEGRKGRSNALLLMGEVIDRWNCTVDKSLDDGVEVVSPVLKSEEENEDSIYRVCDILRLCNQCVSERCGGHIHIGANYLTNINAWKNLLEIWANTENILYVIGNAPNDPPRSEIYEYAAPISVNIESALEKGEVDLTGEEDIERFCEQLTYLQGRPFYRRYSGINFENFGDEDKNTIEFRVSNGTLNPDTWIENINLFGGIVAVAQELSIIQEKIYNGQELTYEEEQKNNAFEAIRNLDNTEKNDVEKLEALMVLAIQWENHHIYRERYKTNKQAMMYRTIVHDVKPIKIGKKPLGRIAFLGDDRVTGEEYAQASSIIESDLEKDKQEQTYK